MTTFRKLVGSALAIDGALRVLREVRQVIRTNYNAFQHGSMNETVRTLTLRKKGGRKPQISAPQQISGPTSTKAAGEKLLDAPRERSGQSETSGKFILYCIIGIKFSDQPRRS